MKKLMAFTLVLVILLSFSGCFEPESYEEFYATYTTTAPSFGYNVDIEDDEPTEEYEYSPESESMADEEAAFEGRSDIAYVMIYNPEIYNEDQSYNKTLSTGSLGSQIDISLSRGDELTDIPEGYTSVSQADLNAGMENVPIDFSGARADGLQKDYRLGDYTQFYLGYPSDGRSLQTVECVYSGSYCVIWTPLGCMSQSEVYDFGVEFDTKIYPETTKTFGTHRYADVGGKVHLIFGPINDHTGGYFWLYDLFATGELRQSDIETYGCNTDHAMIHVDSNCAKNNKAFAISTMAHEFQHLINGSDAFFVDRGAYANFMSQSWINESFSGYIEEYLYPGAMDVGNRYNAFMNSNLIRHGQSMYNFKTNITSTEYDIGVYGSVFLFSQYLQKVGGHDTFRKFHEYWRYSLSQSIDDAEALYNSIPSPDSITACYRYPSGIAFKSKEQEWLSKLVLDFYLDLLKYDTGDPAAFGKYDPQALLYDEINSANIEGGGRIIVATADGTFDIPNDADYGLIYIGLNSNFEPITDIIYK